MELLLRSVDIDEKTLGPNSPDLATTLTNLAFVQIDRGFLSQGENLLLRSLEIDQKALGNDHPYVAADLNNLAHFYMDHGSFEIRGLF